MLIQNTYVQGKAMSEEARKFRRFPPDEGEVAWIDPNAEDDKRDFKPTIAALVTDESFNGCGLVVLSRDSIIRDTDCMIRVGDLPPILSKVRWVKDLGTDAWKASVTFLE